ncbi:MAG: single-stranded DNA-binding protein [Sphaerochaetaceae bacterium]|nr:single-stranded DNA-binding protein [Sphaerochaetaceae bacterium]
MASAADINVVVLVGRLTRDCEKRSTPQGGSVCRFSIAVNRKKRTDTGWVDEVSYFDIVLFGRSADNIGQYLTKGRQVSIEGELRQSRWTAQDGKTQSRVEIYANNVQLIGGNGTETMPSGRQNGPMGQSQYGGMTQAEPIGSMDSLDNGPEAFDDSDIPF